jgi:hypothetical protein
MGRDCRTIPIGMRLPPRPTKHDTQGRDETASPRRRIWMMVDGGLQLTELADLTDRAGDSDRQD